MTRTKTPRRRCRRHNLFALWLADGNTNSRGVPRDLAHSYDRAPLAPGNRCVQTTLSGRPKRVEDAGTHYTTVVFDRNFSSTALTTAGEQTRDLETRASRLH
ncbi:hypothetical protein MRX96_058964 [Rhipicephalus microplus]